VTHTGLPTGRSRTADGRLPAGELRPTRQGVDQCRARV